MYARITVATYLQLHESTGVALEVGVVDLAHGVHVLIPHFLGYMALIGHQKLVEDSAHTSY